MTKINLKTISLLFLSALSIGFIVFVLSPKDADAAATSIYRFYNITTKTHFYTASLSERDNVIAKWPGTYRYEGVAWTRTSTPVTIYRFYNLSTKTHFYTASLTERNNVIAKWPGTYRYEGVAWNDVNPGPAIYRFYNRVTHTHFYTANSVERDKVIRLWSSTYRYEGVAWGGEGTVTPSPPAGSLNVKDFGAKGDGVTDDAYAFERALTAAYPIKGTVYAPTGTYLLTTGKVIGDNADLYTNIGVPSGVTLMGDGIDKTVFIGAGTTSQNIIASANTSDITLKDFSTRVDDSRQPNNQQDGVKLESVQNVLVQNVSSKNTYIGINIIGSQHVTVDNYQTTRNNWVGISANDYGPYTGTNDITIKNSTVTDSDKMGLWISGKPDLPPAQFNLTIDNVVASDNGWSGIGVQYTKGVRITNSKASGNQSGGFVIMFSNDGLILDRCEANNNTAGDTSKSGIDLAYNPFSINTTVSNCVASGNIRGYNEITTITGNHVYNNDFRNNTNPPIWSENTVWENNLTSTSASSGNILLASSRAFETVGSWFNELFNSVVIFMQRFFF